MKLEDCRKEIDLIDREMVKLFCQRMSVAEKVAEYKKENGLSSLDTGRERTLLEGVEEMAGEKYGDYARRLYGSMLEISRTHQNKILVPTSEISDEIQKATQNTPKLFPEKAVVACQGIEGAYSMSACEKLFEKPSIMFCQSFEAVFQSVEKGLCDYGVIPIENSTAGSVNQTYSLMSKYNFKIVRSTKLHIEHSLIAQKGAKLSDIKKIYSHPQAISQCSDFLSMLDGVEIIPCENTAIAAKKVADGEKNEAAICSVNCASQYSLNILCEKIQNSANNYTRFICFTRKTEIYPGADRTSLLIKIPHKAGSLCNVILNFYALGINIIKLESRAIPESDFEFMFYFDIEVPVYSDKLVRVVNQLEAALGKNQIKYLGSYREA